MQWGLAFTTQLLATMWSTCWDEQTHKVFLHQNLYARTFKVVGYMSMIKDTQMDRFIWRVCKKNPLVSACILDTFGQACIELGSTYNNPIYVKLTEIVSAFSRTLKIWAMISVSRDVSAVKVVKIINDKTLHIFLYRSQVVARKS